MRKIMIVAHPILLNEFIWFMIPKEAMAKEKTVLPGRKHLAILVLPAPKA